jgi:hypothetical protein
MLMTKKQTGTVIRGTPTIWRNRANLENPTWSHVCSRLRCGISSRRSASARNQNPEIIVIMSAYKEIRNIDIMAIVGEWGPPGIQ